MVKLYNKLLFYYLLLCFLSEITDHFIEAAAGVRRAFYPSFDASDQKAYFKICIYWGVRLRICVGWGTSHRQQIESTALN